jgi:hypothetical protein
MRYILHGAVVLLEAELHTPPARCYQGMDPFQCERFILFPFLGVNSSKMRYLQSSLVLLEAEIHARELTGVTGRVFQGPKTNLRCVHSLC